MTNYGTVPRFDPADAEPIFEPSTPTEGYWVGAPAAFRHEGETYLAVRERTLDERGHTVAIHRQRGPSTYERAWSVTADELGVTSLERAALVRDPRSGRCHLYLSVDDGGWSIQKLDDAPAPDAFDPRTARDVLAPSDDGTDASGVKDPYVLTVGHRYVMFYSGSDGRSEQAHLATSADGESWTRAAANPVLGRQHWHDHHTRVACALPARDAPA